jgi:hypothetical protein
MEARPGFGEEAGKTLSFISVRVTNKWNFSAVEDDDYLLAMANPN